MDTHAVYDEATRLVHNFRNDEHHLQHIAQEFHNALLQVLEDNTATEHVKDRILAAAKSGSDQIELMRFLGNEVHLPSGFAMLSLVKGSKTADFNAIMRETHGYVSIMELLKKEFAPFHVHHTWNTRTTLNRVLLKWPVETRHQEEEESQASCTNEAVF